MSAKYAPGPWKWQQPEDAPNPCHAELTRAGTVIGEYDSIAYHGADWPMNDADACLIAEAPAMVELVRAFVSYLEDDSRSERRRQACLSEARAILARIEGSQ